MDVLITILITAPLTTFITLLMVASGSFSREDEAYMQGYNAGYTEGHMKGYAEGMSAGYRASNVLEKEGAERG